jgi:hypothetical protein
MPYFVSLLSNRFIFIRFEVSTAVTMMIIIRFIFISRLSESLINCEAVSKQLNWNQCFAKICYKGSSEGMLSGSASCCDPFNPGERAPCTRLLEERIFASVFWRWEWKKQVRKWSVLSAHIRIRWWNVAKNVTGDPEDRSEIFLRNVSDFQLTTRRFIPEDRNFFSHCCENVKCEKLRNVYIA